MPFYRNGKSCIRDILENDFLSHKKSGSPPLDNSRQDPAATKKSCSLDDIRIPKPIVIGGDFSG
jgi:hypothetical protein